MSVKAKFICDAVIPNSWNDGSKTVHFHAVYGKEGENADYAAATPSGSISMMISPGTTAVDFFQQGKEYYLLFQEV